MEAYGRSLQRLRGNRSRRQVARSLGITEASLKAYEEGKRIPRDEVKSRIQRWIWREIQL